MRRAPELRAHSRLAESAPDSWRWLISLTILKVAIGFFYALRAHRRRGHQSRPGTHARTELTPGFQILGPGAGS